MLLRLVGELFISHASSRIQIEDGIVAADKSVTR